jgi:hypothetical protein
MGRNFERKWIFGRESLSEEMLSAPDFSATIDLYSIVAGLRQLRIIPVSVSSISLLILVALIPGIPVILSVVPFQTVLNEVVHIFL